MTTLNLFFDLSIRTSIFCPSFSSSCHHLNGLGGGGGGWGAWPARLARYFLFPKHTKKSSRHGDRSAPASVTTPVREITIFLFLLVVRFVLLFALSTYLCPSVRSSVAGFVLYSSVLLKYWERCAGLEWIEMWRCFNIRHFMTMSWSLTVRTKPKYTRIYVNLLHFIRCKPFVASCREMLLRRKYYKGNHIDVLTYLPTSLLTPWRRAFLEKLLSSQLFKNFPAFCGTQLFITAFTCIRQMSISWTKQTNIQIWNTEF